MKQVRTFRIYWVDEDANGHDDYIQAISVKQAVEFLDIRPDDIVDVSIVMKDWRRSLR